MFNLRDYQPGLRNPDPEFLLPPRSAEYEFARKPAGSTFTQLARANPGH